MTQQVDVLVIGAGPAGSSAAREAARTGASVLVVDARRTIGAPVQCAEFVPRGIADWVHIEPGWIAQDIERLESHLPDGTLLDTAAPGWLVHRALFDKALAAAACRAGAGLWPGAHAIERTTEGVRIRIDDRDIMVSARVIVGADGPHSSAGRWIGQVNREWVSAAQVEVMLRRAVSRTHVYFDPLYAGGYGWLFPKGDTANVGVGVDRRTGRNPRAGLEHLLRRLADEVGPVLGRTAGDIPVGGPLPELYAQGLLLAGDAAGLAHPVTGAGIFAAVASGSLAGQAAAAALSAGSTCPLSDYAKAIDVMFGSSLRHAHASRLEMLQGWNDNPAQLTTLLDRTWIACPGYRKRADPRGTPLSITPRVEEI
jgi:digeranylgeranylglycerophospholipid reductase